MDGARRKDAERKAVAKTYAEGPNCEQHWWDREALEGLEVHVLKAIVRPIWFRLKTAVALAMLRRKEDAIVGLLKYAHETLIFN